ncbi:MAG: DUF2232 domain-containing protein [Clostridium sp.]|nr:DUF2232 domain-containing protein [Clostridium sp.]
MDQKSDTKALVNSALISALIVIITIIFNYLLLSSIINTILIPIIIAIVYVKYGAKYSVSCIVLSSILTSVLLSPLKGIPTIICYGIIGVILGREIKLKRNSNSILWIIFFSFIISTVLEVILTGFIIGQYNPIKYIKEIVNVQHEFIISYIEAFIANGQSLGFPESILSNYEQIKNVFNIGMVYSIIPSMIIFSSFISSILTIQLYEFICKRLKMLNNTKLDMSMIYISNLIGAGLIASISICIILINKHVLWANYFGNAFKLITLILMTINGVCAIEYFLKRKMGVPKGARLIIIIVTLLFSGGIIYSIIGFVEMILDFRKLDPHRLRKA